MSKSILVTDTPKSCETCELCAVIMGKHYCPKKGTYVGKGERDCSCPLKLVPERMDPSKARGAYDVGYIEGYNNCLSKITGGSNE